LELVSPHVATTRQDVGFGRAGVGFICGDDRQSHRRQNKEPGTPHVLRHPSATFCNTQRFVTGFTFVVSCFGYCVVTYFMTFSNAEDSRWGAHGGAVV
jgi:hypothetical protein